MCGRFFIDDETAREIQRLVRTTNDKMQAAVSESGLRIAAEDIYPSGKAPVLSADKSGSGICCEWQKWGFQGRVPGKKEQTGTLIFNARCETVTERPMFRDHIACHRIIIPASGFYEWNRQKEKFTFTGRNKKVLLMAGFYKLTEAGKNFVILTTGANASMQAVHDRMPLILEEADVEDWIFRREKAEKLLQKVPGELVSATEYRQMGLFE